ncbi:hypothetical protein FGG78_22390 [Thioclava sp. BHET1]|nr:hypothetical protein FGG78_22390 [Thioclava sp. BHET1]
MEEIVRSAGLDPAAFRALPEARRLALIRAAGILPADHAPVPDAPARGPTIGFMPMKAYPKGESDWEYKPAGHNGRRALRMADAFDVMLAQAARGRRAAPFTSGQIAMGRSYQQLVERHAAAGIKCSQLDSRVGGGASGGTGTGASFMDAVLQDGRQIDLIRSRIGTGVALAVRRLRPSTRAGGKARQAITDRQLVDLVCLEELTVSQALEACGWDCNGANAKALRAALCAALDRMAGPGRRPGILVATTATDGQSA